MSAGFTLSEMLVSLAVLGVSAGTMSTTMGTAFTSYERLNTASNDLTTQRHLTHIMNEVSGRLWMPNGAKKEQVLLELKVNSPAFQKLSIIQDTDKRWSLYAHTTGHDDTRLFVSDTKMRFLVLSTEQKNPNVRSRPYDYHMVRVEKQNTEWETIISAPLKIDENPSCRFDIVGRRCR